MSLNLTILYRGDLSSCNYACPYCPFAKHRESSEELRRDQQGLTRFVQWFTSRRDGRFSVFFTPWGEALVRKWYRDAIVALSHVPYIHKVAVQTNLSCDVGWLERSHIQKLGFWCTYHPGQVDQASFLAKCKQLRELGISHSVGCVGLREHVSEIRRLRDVLPPETYLWINAFKSEPNYYDELTLREFTAVDSLFPINNKRHPSQGLECRTGKTAITVDSRGDVRRCHFVNQVIGNLYDPEFERTLQKRPCPNAACGCHIGYVHLPHLQLDEVFGEGLLERVARVAWRLNS